MLSLILASNNIYKAAEIQSVVKDQFHIISMETAGIFMDIPEPYFTLEENAREKSKTIYQLSGKNCFSEDTGLEVDALDGGPGALTARYAGEAKSTLNNVNRLLIRLKDTTNRKARFRSIISLMMDEKETQFEGICDGQLSTVPKGRAGFGYDPIFIPDGADKTFAAMTLEEKNSYSHRVKALMKMLEYLKPML